MNKGILMASGEFIVLLNSDDYYEPVALEIMKNKYETLDGKEKKHLVMYGFQRIVKENKDLAIYNHENIDKQMISHPTCFVSKDTYMDCGLFNTEYKSATDYDFMMRLYHKTNTFFILALFIF